MKKLKLREMKGGVYRVMTTIAPVSMARLRNNLKFGEKLQTQQWSNREKEEKNVRYLGGQSRPTRELAS